MTTRERQTCDCPEQPCVCSQEGYAAGQYQALADFISSIENESCHTKRCSCAICYIRQTWDEIKTGGTDPETIAKKMSGVHQGTEAVLGVTIVFMPTTRGRARARCSPDGAEPRFPTAPGVRPDRRDAGQPGPRRGGAEILN